MKKTVLFSLMLAILIMICGCGDSNVCEICTDADADGYCDVCGDITENEEQEPTHNSCMDSDSNGECDVCNSKMPDAAEDVILVKEGEIKFSIVVSESATSEIHKKTDSLISTLSKLGLKAEKLADKSITKTEGCEILIGNVKSRGEEYNVDGRIYGFSGYAVKAVADKVVIVGGSENAIIEGIDYFTEEILGITSSTKKIKNASLTSENQKEYYFTDYKISSVSIGGRDIAGYVISVDSAESECVKLAKYIQSTLFEYSGYILDIVEKGSVTDKYIAVNRAQRSGDEGFYVRLDGENLNIVSEYACETYEAGERYFTRFVKASTGEVSLGEQTINVRDVTYESFGAVGDGRTDDTEAIRKTHEHANTAAHRVVGNNLATYYIKNIRKTIVIKTDVYWGNANFIIDDREVDVTNPTDNVSLFIVSQSLGGTTLTPQTSEAIRAINESGGIDSKTVKRLDLGLGYSALLSVINENHINYIRTGGSANDGMTQRELILIDEYGNIDESTPFLFDYTEITKINVVNILDEPITIEGGIFTTRANSSPNTRTYCSRNIVVRRPNTTLKNIVHKITDEPEGRYDSSAYSGFIAISGTSNIRIEGCVFSSHKTYSYITEANVFINVGSYDVTVSNSNAISFKGCSQLNFFESEGVPYYAADRWGVMESDLSKNISYEDCMLSRFDAHCGVYNASLKNCTVVYISVIGGGTLTVEDTTIYNNNVIQLRSDYGSTWNGDIKVKNVTLKNVEPAVFFKTDKWQNHDFGYQTYLPRNVVIDGLKINGKAISLFEDKFVEQGNIGAESYGEVKNLNPMKAVQSVTLKNNGQDIDFIFPTTEYFKDMVIVTEEN